MLIRHSSLSVTIICQYIVATVLDTTKDKSGVIRYKTYGFTKNSEADNITLPEGISNFLDRQDKDATDSDTKVILIKNLVSTSGIGNERQWHHILCGVSGKTEAMPTCYTKKIDPVVELGKKLELSDDGMLIFWGWVINAYKIPVKPNMFVRSIRCLSGCGCSKDTNKETNVYGVVPSPSYLFSKIARMIPGNEVLPTRKEIRRRIFCKLLDAFLFKVFAGGYSQGHFTPKLRRKRKPTDVEMVDRDALIGRPKIILSLKLTHTLQTSLTEKKINKSDFWIILRDQAVNFNYTFMDVGFVIVDSRGKDYEVKDRFILTLESEMDNDSLYVKYGDKRYDESWVELFSVFSILPLLKRLSIYVGTLTIDKIKWIKSHKLTELELICHGISGNSLEELQQYVGEECKLILGVICGMTNEDNMIERVLSANPYGITFLFGTEKEIMWEKVNEIAMSKRAKKVKIMNYFGTISVAFVANILNFDLEEFILNDFYINQRDFEDVLKSIIRTESNIKTVKMVIAHSLNKQTSNGSGMVNCGAIGMTIKYYNIKVTTETFEELDLRNFVVDRNIAEFLSSLSVTRLKLIIISEPACLSACFNPNGKLFKSLQSLDLECFYSKGTELYDVRMLKDRGCNIVRFEIRIASSQ